MALRKTMDLKCLSNVRVFKVSSEVPLTRFHPDSMCTGKKKVLSVCISNSVLHLDI
jgi:hypothetical protein